jgi:hypothetical protein
VYPPGPIGRLKPDPSVATGAVSDATAESICEAFAVVVKEMRGEIESFQEKHKREYGALQSELDGHLATRGSQDATVQQLIAGVRNVESQLENAEAFAKQTNALTGGFNDTAQRLAWLESRLGKSGQPAGWEKSAEKLQWLMSQLDKTMKAELAKYSSAMAAARQGAAVDRAVLRRQLEGQQQSIDDISTAVRLHGTGEIACIASEAVVQVAGDLSTLTAELKGVNESHEFLLEELTGKQETFQQTTEQQLKQLNHQMSVEMKATVGELSSAFGEYQQQSEAERQLERQRRAEALKAKIVIRLKNMQIASCFGQWAHMTGECVVQKALVRKVAMRMKNMGLSQCFGHWAGMAREAKKQKQDKAWARQQDSLNVVMARLDPGGDGVVDKGEFTTWAQQQAVMVEMWKKEVQDALAEMNKKTAQINRQMDAKTAHLAGAFGEFQQKSEDEKELERQRRAEALKAKIVMRMRNMQIASCFFQWADTAAGKAEQKALVRKVAMRIKNMGLSQCFGHWAGMAREAKKQKRDKAWARQQDSLNVVMARLDPGGDGVVDKVEFTTWAQQQAVMIEMWQQQVQDVLVEMNENTASHVSKDELERRLDRLEQNFSTNFQDQFGELSAAFGEYQQQSEAERQLERQRQAEALKAKIVIRLKNMQIASCFGQWVHMTGERAVQKALVRKVAMRMKNMGLSQCFSQWSGAVRTAKREKLDAAAMHKILIRMKSRKISIYFGQWTGNVRVAQRAKQEHTKARNDALLQQVLAQLEADVMGKGEFTAWAKQQQAKLMSLQDSMMMEMLSSTDKVAAVEVELLEQLAILNMEVAKQGNFQVEPGSHAF